MHPDRRAADRDRLSYWADAPGQDAARDADPARLAVRSVRLLGSAWGWAPLTATWRETATAVVRTASALPADARVRTQGHVLTVAELASTLTVEAAVHHLDLVQHLGRAGPGPLALGEARRVLELLHGGPLPGDHAAAVRHGTGRLPVDGRWLRLLG